MRCAVLGAGSWGTALGALLAAKGFPVTTWDKDTAVLDEIARAHRNERYLPGVALPASLHSTPDLARALEGSERVARYHGGVGLPSTVENIDYEQRQLMNVEAKRLIARLPVPKRRCRRNA